LQLKGLPVQKVRGTTWHHGSTIFPTGKQPPKFGNFFAFTAEEALPHRMSNDIIAKNCDEKVC